MALRPGRTTRKIERPYTRVSQRVAKKSYVVGVPGLRTHHFEMGNKDGKFDVSVYLIAKSNAQIRDNSIEAGRVVAHRFLEKKLGANNYFMKILKYPHHVIREKPIATGAGADRYSQGMRLSFGKPSNRAIQAFKGERLVEIRTKKENVEIAKQALRKFGYKIATPTRIEVVE
jgi:large subunit ribosomal protein L10e